MHPLLILSLKIAKVKFLGVKLSNLIRQHSIDIHVAILPTVFKDKLPTRPGIKPYVSPVHDMLHVEMSD